MCTAYKTCRLAIKFCLVSTYLSCKDVLVCKLTNAAVKDDNGPSGYTSIRAYNMSTKVLGFRSFR